MQAIEKLANALSLAVPGPYTQDWEYEVSDADRLDDFISYYENTDLSAAEALLLMEIILDSYNMYVLQNGPHEGYAERISRQLKAECSLFQETLRYWACLGASLDDSFAITPWTRQILRETQSPGA